MYSTKTVKKQWKNQQIPYLKKRGSHFLVQLDSDVVDFYRQRAKKVGKDPNKYLSELLTKGTNE